MLLEIFRPKSQFVAKTTLVENRNAPSSTRTIIWAIRSAAGVSECFAVHRCNTVNEMYVCNECPKVSANVPRRIQA
jgi:hypothetical protein